MSSNKQCEFPSCRAHASGEHHIIPTRMGGKYKPENLIWLCKEHHDRAEGICDKCYNILFCSRKKFIECYRFDDALPPIHFKPKTPSYIQQDDSDRFVCPICKNRAITRRSVWDINIYTQEYSALYTCEKGHSFFLVMNKMQWRKAVDDIKVDLRTISYDEPIVTYSCTDSKQLNHPFTDASISTSAIKLPYLECPRIQKCSVNNCPLHPGYPDLHIDEADIQVKCTLPKSTRLDISKRYTNILKFQGLTSREFAARIRWDSLPQEERAKIIERTKKNRFVSISQREVTQEMVGLPVTQTSGQKTLISTET